MMQNDIKTVKTKMRKINQIKKLINSNYYFALFVQKFPWILADTEAVTAFEDSSLIPLKSLESDVFKVKKNLDYFFHFLNTDNVIIYFNSSNQLPKKLINKYLDLK